MPAGVTASEEHAVRLTTNLGKVDCRGRRRHKPETVSRALRCGHREDKSRGGLDEVPRELIHGIAESGDAPGHATPPQVKGVDDGAHNVAKRTGGIEAIRNREGIKH